MKPYGSDSIDPKVRCDIKDNSSHGMSNLPRNADGDMHNSVRNSAAKRAGRRHLKRVARAEGKKECDVELEEKCEFDSCDD